MVSCGSHGFIKNINLGILGRISGNFLTITFKLANQPYSNPSSNLHMEMKIRHNLGMQAPLKKKKSKSFGWFG